MGSLLELLEHYEIGDEDMQDEMGWILDEEKGFTVRSMAGALCPLSDRSYPGDCVWNQLIQLKVSFLLWELWWDRVLTVDNLIRRGMIIPNRCCMCMADAKSFGHLFIHCAWVRPLWGYYLSHFDVNWV